MSEALTVGQGLDKLITEGERYLSNLQKLKADAEVNLSTAQANVARVKAVITQVQENQAKLIKFRAQAAEQHFDSHPAPESFREAAYATENATVAAQVEPLWKTIQRVMSGKERFVGVEAADAVERELGRSLGKNRSQMIRNNLVRKPEIFRYNEADSSWTVIRSEKEVPIEETS
jgi:hypothetical protein